MILRSLTVLFLVVVISTEAYHFLRGKYRKERKFVAKCVMNNNNVTGVITLEQRKKKEPMIIRGKIQGLKPGEHGFHIHTFGDISKDCEKTGPNFDLYEAKHGGHKYQHGHLGGLGNIKADSKGNAKFEVKDHGNTFYGKRSVLGRSIVVHANSDESKYLGNHILGNSGENVGCCVIGLAHY